MIRIVNNSFKFSEEFIHSISVKYYIIETLGMGFYPPTYRGERKTTLSMLPACGLMSLKKGCPQSA